MGRSAQSNVRRIWAAGFGVLLAGAAAGYNMPPYEVYPYLADAGDDPPVNYTKVVEPGRTGEGQASYVVLGVFFPRTYQAVAGDFSGELAIPAYIDGLPVRKINEAAFAECSMLRSVTIPDTVREIGGRAFQGCLMLTNVTIGAGVRTLGDAVFSNCVALTTVRFPKSLSRLGGGCFQGCVGLTDVYFSGDAPRLPAFGGSDKSVLGESIFRQSGYGERFRIHINRNTSGWIAPYVKGVPEKWPVDCGFMAAHETVAETGEESEAPASGFVTVVTEIRGGAVAVPESWADRFPDYEEMFGGDFPASLTRPTGKKDAEGGALAVWQDYVAGTDPTCIDDLFLATIELKDGRPQVSVLPELPESEKGKRIYTILGKRRISDDGWVTVVPGEETECNFFKVTVEMR